MPDYSKGKIYKIVNTVNEKVYIGSTTLTLAQSMTNHRMGAKTKDTKLYKAMRRHGVANFKIELIKSVSCSDRANLEYVEFQVTCKLKVAGVQLYNSRFDGKRVMSKWLRGREHPRFIKGCVSWKDGRSSRWEFTWRENGKQRSKSFSKNKYGHDAAKRLAEEYRDYIYPIE